MTFAYLLAMLQKHDLRISHMEERTDQQYVEYKDRHGKDAWKYLYHNLKTINVASWNVADVSNAVFFFSSIRDTTWDEVFEDLAKKIREKFGTKVAKRKDTESKRKPKADGR